MSISYTKRGWTNNSPPAINAANLGAMDDGLKLAVDALNTMGDAGQQAVKEIGEAPASTTGGKLVNKITEAGYSLAPATGADNLDNIADGASYKRVQAAKADALNSSTIVAGTIWSSGNDGNGGLAPQAKGILYTVSAPTSTVITVATIGAADAAYLVRAYLPGTPTANYTAFAIIMTSSNSSASIKLQNDGVNLIISLSGMNIQVWQNSGITQTIYVVIQRVLGY